MEITTCKSSVTEQFPAIIDTFGELSTMGYTLYNLIFHLSLFLSVKLISWL